MLGRNSDEAGFFDIIPEPHNNKLEYREGAAPGHVGKKAI